MRTSLFATVMIVVLMHFLSAAAWAAAPNKTAPQGGTFIFNLGAEPSTIHPITSTDLYSRFVKDYVLDSLLDRDAETYEWKPRLAEKWEISKDKKVFTFFLRKNAFFHDGHPVTAEDVKFSFDAVFNPAYSAAHLIPYFEGLSRVEIVDPYTVKFYTKDNYYKNFDTAASLLKVIPKHIYSDVEKSKKMNKQIIGCGPYALDSYDRGQKIMLKKFDKWYGNSNAEYKGSYNFEYIKMTFVKEENVELEMIKKGDLDYLALTAEAYNKKTEGEPWGTKVIKYKVENSAPKSYGFIGWNFRRDLMKDRNVRLALAHLLNREEMNKKFRYGMGQLATGPYYIGSMYHSPNIKAIEYNPTKALEILKKAGWTDSNKDGVLDKMVGGKREDLRFTLIHSSKDAEKYFTMYKEDLKKAGIDMEIKYLEWNSFVKLLDDGNFDAVALAWGGGDVDEDPKQIWHSSSAVPGGSNFIAYKNPETDKLIDQARQEYDLNKRKKLLQKFDEIVAADAPYAFLFNDKFSMYATTAKIKKPADTFKYEIGRDYWWLEKQ